ncbi:MAG: integration host factor subunit beta [Paludibacteraceae bacterium]|nr:integration host factor subunit beta [Paludibacteraceae bacterium]
MTKAELINDIAISTGYDKTTISKVVESYMDNVKKSLVEGENVYLRGFGTFQIKVRKAKIARNIYASKSVPVPSHRVATFKPCKEFANEMRS